MAGAAATGRFTRLDGHEADLQARRPRCSGRPGRPTVEVFGIDVAFGRLRAAFADVQWLRYEDELRCTNPADVLAYACSTPPGEDATPAQRAALEAAIARAFTQGGGVMTITKDVGCFVGRTPRRL